MFFKSHFPHSVIYTSYTKGWLCHVMRHTVHASFDSSTSVCCSGLKPALRGSVKIHKRAFSVELKGKLSHFLNLIMRYNHQVTQAELVHWGNTCKQHAFFHRHCGQVGSFVGLKTQETYKKNPTVYDNTGWERAEYPYSQRMTILIG